MVGHILAHYRITDRLGAGGMAVVWKATDLQLERDVALKTLPPEVASDPDRVARFLREARCASALNHPNIVTIYEANTAADTPYIAMEYIRGLTLAQRLREQPLGVTRSVEIARQICSALAQAHDAGIVHRDLKPGNIMLTSEGVVKVLDFGIAKRAAVAVEAEDATVTAITVAGTTIGTVAYMSPEQALGDEVDSRSDIFSLGVVLYEMLSLTRPFDGKTMVTAVRSLVHSDPRPLREIVPEVPVALEKVVERCLAKDRDHRYQSASELADALEHALASTAATAAPTAAAEVVPPNKTPAIFGSAGTRGRRCFRCGRRGPCRRIAVHAAGFGDGNGDAEAVAYTSEVQASRAARGYLDRYDKKGNIDRAVDSSGGRASDGPGLCAGIGCDERSLSPA